MYLAHQIGAANVFRGQIIGINSPLGQQQSVRQKAAQGQTLLVRMSKSATVQIIQNTLFLFANFIINKKAVLRSTILYPQHQQIKISPVNSSGFEKYHLIFRLVGVLKIGGCALILAAGYYFIQTSKNKQFVSFNIYYQIPSVE